MAAGDLTTLAGVRERLQIPVLETDKDALISTLITEVTDAIQSELRGRKIVEATYTEYPPGTGTEVLFLAQGPLVSVTSINSVVYSDAGSGARQEDLTVLDPFLYVLDNLRTEHSLGRGIIRRVDSGTFDRDHARRWKVVYVAGWSTIPSAITHLATTWVTHEYQNREARWNASRVIDDGQISLLSPAQLAREKDLALSPFVDLSGAY